jgi:hypothetical protein
MNVPASLLMNTKALKRQQGYSSNAKYLVRLVWAQDINGSQQMNKTAPLKMMKMHIFGE